MIKKNFIGLCLLTGLALISCKKNETKPVQSNDSATIETAAQDSAKTDTTTEKTVTDAVNSIEGKYVVTKGCESGNYSIEFSNVKDGKVSYKIFDKTKEMSSGTGSVIKNAPGETGTGINLGVVGDTELIIVVEGNKFEIQNDGNNMNPFQHFKDCNDKYLEFSKK
ncbi:hypothetical protein [Chryseobacterium daeguense]|uniref:hypothetical protein n=1 Tax=Chryseobacterium daeguense TaxID=412438 RepID=UPI0004290029|nr:hypothetical protein [Chryseobacterium daeguense]